MKEPERERNKFWMLLVKIILKIGGITFIAISIKLMFAVVELLVTMIEVLELVNQANFLWIIFALITSTLGLIISWCIAVMLFIFGVTFILYKI